MRTKFKKGDKLVCVSSDRPRFEVGQTYNLLGTEGNHAFIESKSDFVPLPYIGLIKGKKIIVNFLMGSVTFELKEVNNG